MLWFFAGDGLESLIEEAHRIAEEFLKPDGVSADAAMGQIVELVDGPRQRAIQNAWHQARRSVEITQFAEVAV